MRTTITLSQNLSCSPFEILAQDVDEVIMMINFYLALGNEKRNRNSKVSVSKNEQRIRVNDDTATGGWW